MLGTSSRSIATYPGDFAQALIALDAEVEIRCGRKRHQIAFADLHRPPGDRPDIETSLAPDEMMSRSSFLPLSGSRRSRFVKVRDLRSGALDTAQDGDERSGSQTTTLNGVVRDATSRAADRSTRSRYLSVWAKSDSGVEARELRGQGTVTLPAPPEAL